MKLKIELYRYGTLLFGRVLEQDESLRRIDDSKCIADRDGFKIKADKSPELRGDTLYIRGANENSDYDIFHYIFLSEERALEVAENIKQLVAEINNGEELAGIERVL